MSCLFTLKDITGFAIIVVYVDDSYLVGTPNSCSRDMSVFTIQFEMKLLGNTTFCPCLQVVYLHDGSIFIHQTTHTQNLLKMFHMDHTSPLSAPGLWWDEVEQLMIPNVLARRKRRRNSMIKNVPHNHRKFFCTCLHTHTRIFLLPLVCLLGTTRDLKRITGMESNTCSKIS